MLASKGSFMVRLAEQFRPINGNSPVAGAAVTIYDLGVETVMNQYTDSQNLSQQSIVREFADLYTLKPHQFIETLFSELPNGFVEVAYLANEGSGLYPRTVVHWAELPLSTLDPELPHVMEMNARGYNVYYAPCARGRKYEPENRISEKSGKPYTVHLRGKAYDATWITALWVDVDTPGEEGYRQLIDNMLPPSIVLSSGGGWHGYWLLTEPMSVDESNRDTIKRTLKGMALACGGDTKVADLARIMRLPGTVNTKPRRGQTCVVRDFIPGRYYYNDLEVTYAPLAAPARPTIHRVIPMDASAGMPHWVENYLNTGAVSGERNNTAYAATRALLDNGFSMSDTERLIRNRALSDGLSDQEIDILLNSAENAARSAPDVDPQIGNVIAADDHLLRQRKGRAS